MSADADGLEWTAEGAPRSRRFDDVYFSRADGLAESRAVFLEGCGLPEAWAGRRRFVVGELGFGTGLNVLALLELWARTRPANGRLSMFSVEAFPLSRADAARALAVWPEMRALAAPLLERWPTAPGVTRIDWPALGATLDVAVAEVGVALAGWTGRADAWFLDGFSPARNPEMWRDDVLAAVTARSAPDARLGTFTVAGAVRRGLAAQGWTAERRPGHGGKRQRLESCLGGAAAATVANPAEVVVIGAGVAGAALSRALRAQGLHVTVVAGPATGASANAAGLVSPRLELGTEPAARLSAQAFRRAVDLYNSQAPEAVLARGVRRLHVDEARLARLAASELFEADALVLEPADAAEAAMSEPVGGALLMRDALAVSPERVVSRWLEDAARVEAQVRRLERAGDRWRLLAEDGRVVAQAQAVVVAGGWGAAALWPELELRAVRGQVSLAPDLTGAAASWGGYCAPTPEGLLFGATHDRGDEGDDVRGADHLRNLETLRAVLPGFAEAAERTPLSGRAGVRAATADHLPLAGALAPGLWILGGLGGRGFTTAPLLAEHVAAEIAGAPSPLPADLAAAVAPGRFRERAERRGAGSRRRSEALVSPTTLAGAGP